jgi:hypothetical protein
MTLSADKVGEIRRTEDDYPQLPTTTAGHRWYSQLFVLPLWAGILYYLYYQIWPFLGVPEQLLPVPPHQGFGIYYPALIVHMSAGTIALLSVCLQLWPWLRQNHPAIHRWTGRAYVFLGAIPGATAGLTIVWFAPPNGKLGVICSTLLWVSTAITAFVWARKGRYDLHRRFMLYSFAAVINPVLGVYFFIIWTKLHFTISFVYLIEANRWLTWILPLILVQTWLWITARRPVE